MKKILYFVVISICSYVNGQIDFENLSVQVKPDWEVDKTYHYIYNDQNITISVNDTILNVTNESEKFLKVLDKNKFAYKLELINGENVSTDPDEFYRDFINNSNGIKYIYTTNSSGELLDLENIEDIRKQFLDITNKLSKNKKITKEYKNNIEELDNMIKSDNYIPYVFDQEIEVLNYFNGNYLKKGEEYVGKSVQDNIFGFPISSTTKTYLENIDSVNETYTIRSNQTLSKEDFEKLWEEMAYYMLNDKNLQLTQDQVKKEIKKYSETVDLRINYVSTYDKNSILLEANYYFVMNIGAKQTLNHLNIKQVPL